MGVIELQVSAKVVSGANKNDDSGVAIPDGKEATVHIYISSCPDSAKATTRLEFGGVILWVMQRSDTLSKKIVVKGDGIKKFDLICDNECTGDYYFNAYAKIGYR